MRKFWKIGIGLAWSSLFNLMFFNDLPVNLLSLLYGVMLVIFSIYAYQNLKRLRMNFKRVLLAALTISILLISLMPLSITPSPQWIWTDKSKYAQGENVVVFMHNAGNAILDSVIDLRIERYEEGIWHEAWSIKLYTLLLWSPSTTFNMTWDQKDYEGKPVPPGRYRVVWTPYINGTPIQPKTCEFEIIGITIVPTPTPTPTQTIEEVKRIKGIGEVRINAPRTLKPGVEYDVKYFLNINQEELNSLIQILKRIRSILCSIPGIKDMLPPWLCGEFKPYLTVYGGASFYLKLETRGGMAYLFS